MFRVRKSSRCSRIHRNLHCIGTRGRPKAEVALSYEERATLERWVRKHKSSQALALRSRIVLACSKGATNNDVAA